MAAVHEYSQHPNPHGQHPEGSYQLLPGATPTPAAHGDYGLIPYGPASPPQQTIVPAYQQFPTSPPPVWTAAYSQRQPQTPQSGAGPSQPAFGYQNQQLPLPVPLPPQLQTAHHGGQPSQVYGNPAHGAYGGPQPVSAQGTTGGYGQYTSGERVQQLRTDVRPAATWPAPQQLPPLPPGWTAYWDARQQKHYYNNAAAGQTTWEPPQASQYPIPRTPTLAHLPALTQSPQSLPQQFEPPQQQQQQQRLQTPIQLPIVAPRPVPQPPQSQRVNSSVDTSTQQYQRPLSGTPANRTPFQGVPPVVTPAELCAEPSSSAARGPAPQHPSASQTGKSQTHSSGPPLPPKAAERPPTATRRSLSPPHSQLELVADMPSLRSTSAQAASSSSNLGQALPNQANPAAPTRIKTPVKQPQPSNIDPSVSPLNSPPRESSAKHPSTPPLMSSTSHGPLSMTEDELSPRSRRAKPSEDEPHVSATFTALADDPMFTDLMVNTGLNAPHNSGMVITRFAGAHGGRRAVTPPNQAISIRNPKPVVPPGAMEVPLLRQRDSIVGYGSPSAAVGGFHSPPQMNGMGQQQMGQQQMGQQLGQMNPLMLPSPMGQQQPGQQADPQQGSITALQQYHSAQAQRAILKHEGTPVDRLRMLAEDLAALSNTIYTALERLPPAYVDELATEMSNDWELVEMDTLLRGVLVTHGREEQQKPNDRWRKQGPPGYNG